MANIVAIVGRPNVGKSTLFNRLIGRREAIMDNVSGVTRDRHYGHAEWIGKYFAVIDTGGYVTGSDDIFEAEIREQVEIAMEEASVILFLVDASEGIHPLDEEFAKVLRRSKKPILLVANKSDNISRQHNSAEFYNLGVKGEVWPISSQSGSGSGELLDELVKYFPQEGVEDPDAGIPRISILGRPNVGKSSFLNTILGYKRSIVTDIAGTTRDSINARYKAYGNEFIIVDTAGLRRRSKVVEDIEFYSTLRSVQALEDSDVCIIMLDATRGLEAQDLHLIGMAEKARKGIVILVNKWDLIEKDGNTAIEMEKQMRERIANMSYIPIMFISVMTKQRIFQAIEKAIHVYNNKQNKISTSQLNEKMLPEIEAYPPPAIKGKYIKIKYITQLPSKTPSFAFFCNLPQYIQAPYERYLENRLREHFDFEGVPVNLFFRQK